MHGARHIRIVVEVMIFHRLHDYPRLLRGVGAVQIDQRPITRTSLKDGKVRANVFDVERDRLIRDVDLVKSDGGRVLRPTGD